jgi:hypothetical protein
VVNALAQGRGALIRPRRDPLPRPRQPVLETVREEFLRCQQEWPQTCHELIE